MTADVKVKYNGNLYCDIEYLKSQYTIRTDVKNGEFFSPADLFIASLAACTVSNIGFASEGRLPVDARNISCEATKTMEDKPVHKVKAIALALTISGSEQLSDKDKAIIEKAARTCPIKNSISDEIEVQYTFVYS